MPIQAFGESKYFGSGDASRMSDNEQAAPSLRHSEVSAVHNSPGDAIPELNKGIDDGEEVASSIAGKEPRYILSDNPGGAALSNDPVHFPPERATVASQAAALSCNAVVLAWEASADEVNRLNCGSGSAVAVSIPGTTNGAESPFPVCPLCAFSGWHTFSGAPLPFLAYRASNASDIMHILVVGDIRPVLA